MSQINQYHNDLMNLDIINRQKSTLQRSENMFRAKKSFQRKEKILAFKEIQKCYNCGKSEYLSQQCKKSCNNEKKIIAAMLYNSLNWTACQNNMCRIHISNKDKAKWYSQKWQKRHRLYNMIRVLMKKIAIFNWINIEKIDTHGTQKENFPEYNKEIYVFKNDKETIKQKKIWKEAVKQIKIIVKKVINTVWKSQKSEPSTELYNFRWTSAKNDIWDTVL